VRLPATGGPLPWLSLIFPVYYLMLSLYLGTRPGPPDAREDLRVS